MKFAFGLKKFKNWINYGVPCESSIVVCICGMHRSGTSMVAQLLSRCGVYMGPEGVLTVSAADNQDGFWEDSAFVSVNDELLQNFFGGWDLPPRLEEGWEYAAEISAIRDRARELIDQRRAHRFWGWKDPRTSLTLPFWKSLVPDLKVIVCLRHPWEVAQSLHRRNYLSIPFGLILWEEYQKRVLAATDATNRLITNYESHLPDPQTELERILDYLSLQVSPEVFNKAASICQHRLCNNRYEQNVAKVIIPRSIVDLYKQIHAEASPAYVKATNPEYDHCLLGKLA